MEAGGGAEEVRAAELIDLHHHELEHIEDVRDGRAAPGSKPHLLCKVALDVPVASSRTPSATQMKNVRSFMGKLSTGFTSEKFNVPLKLSSHYPFEFDWSQGTFLVQHTFLAGHNIEIFLRKMNLWVRAELAKPAH